MTFTITRTSVPTFQPLTDEEIAQWIRVDEDSDPLTISMLLASATDYVESITGQIVCQCSVQIAYDDVCDFYRLPVYPVQSVTSIAFVDLADGIATPTPYWRGQYIYFSTCPPLPPTITVVAGYASADAVPAPLKHAIAALVSANYDSREGISDATLMGVKRILASSRKAWL